MKVLNYKAGTWLMMLSLFLSTSVTFVSCLSEDNAIDPKPEEPEQEQVITEFFNETVNKMIDENYEQVKTNGYAELVIPASLYPKDLIKFPATDCESMDYVLKSGHTVFVNGGAVRDGILGKELHDVDFSTDATPDELVAIVPNSHKTQAGNITIAQAEHEGGIRTDMVPYYAIDERLKGKPGIIESPYTGQTYSKNLIDDSFRRDMSINALYYDYKTGDIYDFHGGLHDLREKIIRTPIDPDLTFLINPQAMLRDVRFAARYEYTLEEKTAEAIKANLHTINDEVRPSTCRFVVLKGFCDGCAYRTYQYYVKYGILDYLTPMLKDYIGQAEYETYLKTIFDYADERKAMNATLAYAILFMKPVMDELGDKEPTIENITAVFDELEQGSGQDKRFLLEERGSTKKAPMAIWRNYRLMTTDATLEDAALVNSIKRDNTFRNSLLMLNALATQDASLQKYADEWNKDLPEGTDLSVMEGDYTAKDGEVLTGITPYKVIIPDGATVTLESVGIFNAIMCKGDATIILSKGSDNLIANDEYYDSAIQSMADKTLTIKGEGKLLALGGQEGAGIGGNGNIVIENGNIEAYGGDSGAGIGSDMFSPCGDITISGGTVTAVGGDHAAGIGSGEDGECGKIIIKSTVTKVVAAAGLECEDFIGAGVDGTYEELIIEDTSKVFKAELENDDE